MNFRKHLLFSLAFAFIFSFTDFGAVNLLTGHRLARNAVPVSSNLEEKLVIPGGRCVGVTLSTDGVMVVSIADLECKDGICESPAKAAGIKSGDLIKKFNGKDISGVEDLTSAVSDSDGKKSTVVLNRDGKTIETLVYPKVSSADGSFKIGVWVKDAASGIGTMTFYDPQNHTFAALGHGICDPETGNVISVDSGKILTSTIVSVQKGEKGAPGELKGIFTENRSVLGEIIKNNSCGIYGITADDFCVSREPVPIASKNEVHTGSAYILANVEGNNVEKFDVEITRVMPQATPNPKGMVIKITDPALLRKTGGIVQGMSGCPIIQDEKLVGAITHVFVNDPTKGYGIFSEWMLENAETVV